MKKMIPLAFSLLVIACLPACGGRQKPVRVNPTAVTKTPPKEVGWSEHETN